MNASFSSVWKNDALFVKHLMNQGTDTECKQYINKLCPSPQYSFISVSYGIVLLLERSILLDCIQMQLENHAFDMLHIILKCSSSQLHTYFLPLLSEKKVPVRLGQVKGKQNMCCHVSKQQFQGSK